MKKTIAIFLVVLMLVTFVSCSTTEEDTSSISSVGDAVVSAPQFTEPETPDTVQSQESPQDNSVKSTIAKPDEVIFYKNGKYGSLKNANKIYEIAKLVESWYKSYEQDTLPVCNWEYNAETIDEIKQKETVVEICYKDYTQIKMLNKIDHGTQRKIMIPLTGKYAYGVFLGKGEYYYTILLGDLGGSGLEKYFNGITLDKDVRKWESTVITPTKVTFYKDGKQSVSTESDLNRKIAKYIENWFKYATQFKSMPAIITDSNITQQKYNSTAIELEFDSSFTFFGGSISKNTRKIFITIDGEHPYHIFTSNGSNDTTWGNMSPDTWNGEKRNLEPFFEGRKFEENIGDAGDVFNSEKITHVAFYGYGGQGTRVDVPLENINEIINWLGTFTLGKSITTAIPPGTNTNFVEIEYIDGTVVKHGLDVIEVYGVSYELECGKHPECYWDLISQSTLSTTK
ncbi:MAG: hypothetical protein IKT42_07725 [Clostridia bacterium]|nr:hypothetical protein [Clostridia bacterium]